MAAHSSDLSIIEAVETLSSIADLEFDRDVGVSQRHEMMIGNEKIAYKTVHWLNELDASSTVNLVRETFRVVLHYLKHFYKVEYSQVNDQKTLDGIKTIMVLVGEAAKKLDKYTHLFHQSLGSVTELKEFRQLQDFYTSKISKKIDEGIFNQWILGLTLGIGKSGREMAFKSVPKETDALMNTKHVFVDLETVKKDTEYELFFIRKEDGSRFFSPRLLRNVKLVCDFGSYFGEKKGSQIQENIKHWVDKIALLSAKEIIKSLSSRFENYFHEIQKKHDHELVQVLNKAFFALMMSSHTQNLLRYEPAKSCAEYFEDFQFFLREALQTNIYKKWVVNPPKENNQLAHDLIAIVNHLCKTLYTNLKGMEEMKAIIHTLIEEAKSHENKKNFDKISDQIADDHQTISKIYKQHSSGPLLKTLNFLEEGNFQAFDPILQNNLPSPLFDLHIQGKRHAFLRLPSPIYQEFINRGEVNEEFKAFIQYNLKSGLSTHHLLINLQDRTSWREYSRSVSLEKYQYEKEAEKGLTVVTLAIDTDFYHQLSPYHQSNHADVFKEQFKELLLDEKGGYYFPSAILKKVRQFADQAFDLIHQTFFSSKNVLSRENRLDFIEIFHNILELKMIEWLQPDTISLTCKDGIDIGQANIGTLFAFLKFIKSTSWSKEDWTFFNYILYAPALIIRERNILPDRFNRMISALRTINIALDEHGGEKFLNKIKELIPVDYEINY